jgi:hypothetical protein
MATKMTDFGPNRGSAPNIVVNRYLFLAIAPGSATSWAEPSARLPYRWASGKAENASPLT